MNKLCTATASGYSYRWVAPMHPLPPTSTHRPCHALPQGRQPKLHRPATTSTSPGNFAAPLFTPWLLQDHDMPRTGKAWGGLPPHHPPRHTGSAVPAVSLQHREGPQPVDQHLSAPPAATSDRYADCQGTNTFPVSFFKRLNIKRLKCSSYFSVNVAAKYYHVDAACKTKAIDNVIYLGEPLQHRISFTCTGTSYLCLPAQHRSFAVHPCSRDLLGFVFPFAGLLIWQTVTVLCFVLLLSNESCTQHGCSPEQSMGQDD